MEPHRLRSSWLMFGFALSFFFLGAWAPKPVKDDRNVFMPGSQQGSVNLESVTKCDNCHGGYDQNAEPAYNWRGSMMAHAARDPLWLSTMVVALQDSIWQLGNPNAGDLCIRCHSPGGWLGGRSEPVNISGLTGADFEGVTCDFCHRSVDPFNASRQGRDDVPAETTTDGTTAANATYAADYNVLSSLLLFGGTIFFDSSSRQPTHFGSGALPDYVESTGGQFFVDPSVDKRGPRYDASPNHGFYYSRWHKSKYFCGTCHDVSNPALANAVMGAGVPEQQAAASYFHVERTFSEFMLSAYGRGGGAATNAGMNVSWAASCQDCHMPEVTGKLCNKNVAVRSDMKKHDLTGGNIWMSEILASADQSAAGYDLYNYEILSGTKYAGAEVDVGGVQGYGAELLDGAARALQQLQTAATLELVTEEPTTTSLKIINNTGHKLISGYPEGRRMWLNVRFFDSEGTPIEEINPYTPLVTSLDANGDEQYVSGGVLTKSRDDLVYEANMASALTGEPKTFHFVLATGRYKDNRIPPKGFDIANASVRLTVPHWSGSADSSYFTSAEYAGGYDEITFDKPSGTASWTASLYYQTTSKEYMEFLRDEINGTGVLTSPTPSGETEAYIAQTDTFFSTLKGWGNAMWDLWLHNGGSEPLVMTQLSGGVSFPELSISDVAVTEGDERSASAELTVSLSASSASSVTVGYATSQGTAEAGVDYASVDDTLTIAAGATSAMISVPVFGDTKDEWDETFTVTLSNASGARIAGGTATGTITDDDPLHSLVIGDATVMEGDTGSATASFAVTLSGESGKTVTVDYSANDGTAIGGSDYTTTTGTLTFTAGVTSLSVDVPVLGDTIDEPDEIFAVNLFNPGNATIIDATGTGTILDDDVILAFDPNGDGVVSVEDVDYLINYLYANGSAPGSTSLGDANGDQAIAASDIFYTINYLFSDGNPPL